MGCLSERELTVPIRGTLTHVAMERLEVALCAWCSEGSFLASSEGESE